MPYFLQLVFLILFLISINVNGGDKVLSKGKKVLPTGFMEKFRLTGKDKKSASFKIVRVNQPEFQKAMEVKTTRTSVFFWNATVKIPVNFKAQKGDAILLRLYCRSLESDDESGKGRIKVWYKKTPKPFQQAFDATLSASGNWKRYDIPFQLKADQKQGELVFGFSLAEQKVQIGGIELFHFGKKVELKELPRTKFSYDGRSPDAPWRKAAEARIEKFRMGDFTIQIKDAKGKPLSGVKVNVEMARHAFPFGTCIYGGIPLDISSKWKPFTSEDREKYLDILKHYFNTVAPGNNLKMPAWTGFSKNKALSRENTKKLVNWLVKNDFEVCAQSLVWPGWKHLRAPEIGKLKNDPQGMQAFIQQHIESIVPPFKGKIKDWIVINEPRANHDVMDVCGQQVMVDWFKTAHKLDPDAKLYLNDYAILNQEGSTKNLEAEAYDKLIKFLQKHKAPLHGIGFQSHFLSELTPPEKVYQILERFAGTGLEMQITEFDIDTDDEKLQADYTRDFLTIVFSHPQITGFTMWGFWAGDHWRPNGALFDKNWREKPNGIAYRKLVLEKWWTKEKGKSDQHGTFSFRGFFGNYSLKIKHHGKEYNFPLELTKKKQLKEIKLGD